MVTTATAMGRRALTTVPNTISRISRASGKAMTSAFLRSSSKIGAVSWSKAAWPPTSVFSKPGGVPTASRTGTTSSLPSSGEIGIRRVA